MSNNLLIVIIMLLAVIALLLAGVFILNLVATIGARRYECQRGIQNYSWNLSQPRKHWTNFGMQDGEDDGWDVQEMDEGAWGEDPRGNETFAEHRTPSPLQIPEPRTPEITNPPAEARRLSWGDPLETPRIWTGWGESVESWHTAPRWGSPIPTAEWTGIPIDSPESVLTPLHFATPTTRSTLDSEPIVVNVSRQTTFDYDDPSSPPPPPSPFRPSTLPLPTITLPRAPRHATYPQTRRIVTTRQEDPPNPPAPVEEGPRRRRRIFAGR